MQTTMKGSSNFSLSITLLHILMLSTTSLMTQIHSSSDLITQTCKKTPHYDLCVSSLQSNPQASKTTDIKELASIITNLVLSNASDTLSYIKELIKEAKDPKFEHSLANCAEYYIMVVKDDIPQAIEALTRGWYGFTEYVINDASKAAISCEKSFSGFESPLADRNKIVSDLCDVAVAIINILLKN